MNDNQVKQLWKSIRHQPPATGQAVLVSTLHKNLKGYARVTMASISRKEDGTLHSVSITGIEPEYGYFSDENHDDRMKLSGLPYDYWCSIPEPPNSNTITYYTPTSNMHQLRRGK